VATLALGQEVTVQELDEWASAAFSPAVTATLDLLAKHMAPESALTSEDVAVARRAGVSDQALVDALHVAFAFDVINRLADVFGATYEGDVGRRRTAIGLYRMGYAVPDVFLR
jgi:alkylhydroperoxidase family enzyme